jgi:apolipoprotein D and lipocalin family protein
MQKLGGAASAQGPRRKARRVAQLAAALLTGWAACALAAPTLTTKPVDPKKYSGRWYEVARLPNKVESNCDAATSDWSRDSDGGFQVVQTCHIGAANGASKVWRGSGKITDAVNNSKIRIGFFGGLVQMDYWVIDRSDDYSWCMLTTPNPKWFWIMSRHPNLSADEKAALVAKARALGFDVSKLIFDSPPAV